MTISEIWFMISHLGRSSPKERVQSMYDDAAKLLANAKLEPSRGVNSDLCIPDLPLHSQRFQGPSIKAEGSFVWTTISHVRTTPPK